MGYNGTMKMTENEIKTSLISEEERFVSPPPAPAPFPLALASPAHRKSDLGCAGADVRPLWFYRHQERADGGGG